MWLDFHISIYKTSVDIWSTIFHLPIESWYLHRGFHMNTWTWDPNLEWMLDYYNMVASTSTWDPGSPSYHIIMVNTYPWDPCILIKRIEDNSFIWGMECSVSMG
jgi:hypothetical protein